LCPVANYDSHVARQGQEFVDEAAGQRIVVRQTAADTNGELLELAAVYEPASKPPPEHLHPRQDEHFEVTSGEITARIGGVERRYATGESFDVPRGTPHALWNGGEVRAGVIWQTRPALRTEFMLERFFELARSGAMGRGARPNPLLGAVLMQHYRDEFRLANPGEGVQRVVFPPLSLLGRLIGYKAEPDGSGLAGS
jgi:mannose-6-phosphate isomerase-like protein (cupin superfamily)